MSLGICDEMNHSVELRLEASGRAFGLVNVCSQLFWRNKWKLVHVGAFIVLRKSVEVIFSCRLTASIISSACLRVITRTYYTLCTPPCNNTYVLYPMHTSV